MYRLQPNIEGRTPERRMMDIDEAIKQLGRSLNFQYVDESEPRAIQLGIEALERVRILRDSVPAIKLNLVDHLLPSETKEQGETTMAEEEKIKDGKVWVKCLVKEEK